MNIIYVLIPIAMLFVLIAVGIFFWAVKSDQFDDLERQSMSILFDDEPQRSNKVTNVSAASEAIAATTQAPLNDELPVGTVQDNSLSQHSSKPQ
ncbi:MAG: cbb3-type cytochrome oxidase assembly protein CcoS [Shewanella sp.]|uniref:cbb3-type cytochrome oxidase assembly protein CcoS n=1 Tax=Shewanella sp. SNU WT4 TaxID=2590015 RepID=UPI00112AABC2|nr:cbb3-type cytochrome oxidase assembly protein CcoS [Shewanella sp. SNU WT4]QDF67043.1 cbb3-type cytochrome oxidase assembly protein CcoS [Shewanella sp. SNU WT4]